MPQKTQKKDNLPVKVDVDLQNGGTISYANEVIATIAGVAANEIDGIAGMCVSGGFSEILGRNKNITRGVKVEVGSQEAAVDLYVIVEYGKPFQKLAAEVQENVRKALESLTGLHVVRVDVHVQGVSFEKEKKANQNSLEASKNPVLAAPETPAAEKAEAKPEEAQEALSEEKPEETPQIAAEEKPEEAPAAPEEEEKPADEVLSDEALSEEKNAFDEATLSEEAQLDGAPAEEAEAAAPAEEALPPVQEAEPQEQPEPVKRGRKKTVTDGAEPKLPKPRGRKRA
ncbi:MAG: Asp23/Gls24 family envelope stress response protein [Clostridia bacterium]|nr:Asp23/Gls24 family envelope stress response protein [Clostridia bacterium]